MKHGKLIGLQTDAERLARVAVAAYDAATAPQTAPSGSISLDNADGTRTIIGPQAGSGEGAPSGQAMATHVGDTTPPPVPTGITAWSGDGSLHVMWDGTLSGDVPADFSHISILVDGKEVAQLSSAGSVTVGGVEAGDTVSVTATAEDDACLADGTPAHNVSAPCAAFKVTIKDAVAEVRADADAHGEQIEAIQSDIEAYKKSATATYATKTEVDEKTGAITKTLTADYTKSSDIATTYAEKTELQEAVNQLSSTMTSNYSAFTTYRTSNDTAVSKAQSDATNAQSTIDTYKTANDKAVADAKSAGTTAQNQLSSYKSSNDAAVAAAKKAGTDAQSNLDAYRGTTDQRLDELKNIADNAIETWYLKGAPTTSNAPARDWTTDALKKRHAGDLYMDTDTGYSYRWSGTEWVQVKDSDVTKALKEIESVKTDYATKSELTATDKELSGKVSDALTTAKSYTDSSVEQEVTARNAAIKAQADSISLDVSRTYTKSETFSAYQSDADGRIATANANASTAVSTAKTAASDAATAKTNASSAVAALKVTSDAVTAEVEERGKLAGKVGTLESTSGTHASKLEQLASSIKSLVKGESTYTDPDGKSATSGIYSLVTQTRDSVTALFGQYTKTADLASTQAVRDAKKAGTAAQASIDGMRLGGRNLLKGTSMDSKAVTTPTTASTRWGSGFAFPADAALRAVIPYGAEYRCSVDVLLPVDGTIVVDMNTYPNSGTGWTGNDNDNMNKRTSNWPTFNVKANVWTRLSWGSENTSDANTGKQAIYVNDLVGLLPQSAAVTWHYRGLKVELGNKATDWTPAPEDTDSAVADAKKAGTDAKKAASAAQTTANSAKSTADSLATMIREDATGITVGKSADGKTYSTGRTHMDEDSFDVLDKAGNVLSSFGKKIIELGKNSQDAVISMLGGLVTIKATSPGGDGAWCKMSTDELISVEGYRVSRLAAGYKDETGSTAEGTAEVLASGGELDGSVIMYAGARGSDGNSFAMYHNGYFLNHPEYLLKELWQPSVTYTGSNDTYTANAEDWIISHMDGRVGWSRADDYFTFSQGVITVLRDCLLEISGVAYWTSGPVGQYGFGFFVGSSTVKSGTEKSVFNYKASAEGQFSVTMPPINIAMREGTKVAVGRFSQKGSVYRNGNNYSWVTIKVIEDRSG